MIVSQTQRTQGGDRRIPAAPRKLQIVGTHECTTHAHGRTHGGLRAGDRRAGPSEGRGRAPAPLTMNARGSEERSRQLHAPASGRAGLRRDLGRRLRLCAGGGASPLNRAQMPRRRSTRSVSAHQAWLPDPGASEWEPRREDPGSPGSRQVCPLSRQGRWHAVLRTQHTRCRRRVSMRAVSPSQTQRPQCRSSSDAASWAHTSRWETYVLKGQQQTPSNTQQSSAWYNFLLNEKCMLPKGTTEKY